MNPIALWLGIAGVWLGLRGINLLLTEGQDGVSVFWGLSLAGACWSAVPIAPRVVYAVRATTELLRSIAHINPYRAITQISRTA